MASLEVPSTTSIFPTKVLQLSDVRKRNQIRRNGFQRMTFRKYDGNDAFVHAYRGQFIKDNYHGDGQYCQLHRSKGNALIDGNFYCNDLEGYATETTSDGRYYEGLFKENKRFGPGVLTYADNTQDVGLWRGDHLVRLSVVVQSHVIPKLALSVHGKATLIQYRQLIELPEFNQEARLYTVLKSGGAGDTTLRNYQQFCNHTCRNRNSLLFDVKLYDHMFFGQKDNCISVVMNEADLLEKERVKLEQLEREEESRNGPGEVAHDTVEDLLDCVMGEVGGPSRNEEFAAELIYEVIGGMKDRLGRAKEERDLIDIRNNHRRNLQRQYLDKFDKADMKKVPITHLVTWNNEEVAIDLLKHSFLHRNSENLVSFNVCRVLAGDRSDFYGPGPKEKRCIDFLVNCSIGMIEDVCDSVLEGGLDVGVVDGRGNSGVHYAAAKDKLEIIQVLTNFGAKLDCVNDEHLTPLNMCLLRYLAVLYDVTNWEDAFLIDQTAPTKLLYQILDKETAFNPNSSLLTILSKISIERNFKNVRGCRQKPSNVTLVSDQIQNVSMTDILTKLNLVKYTESYYRIETNSADAATVEQDYVVGNKLVRVSSKPKRSRHTPPAAPAAQPSQSSKKKTESKIRLPDDREEQKFKQLSNVRATIAVLLHYGAKPYICDVPLPSLHLAVYTENHSLVEMLLKNGSDVNGILDEFNLTALHAVCTLPTSEENYLIFDSLLRYAADVRINANAAHWPEEKKNVLSNYAGGTLDLNKNCLHIVALRYDHATDTDDYLVAMAEDLIEAHINVEEFYLGHTALSLAVLRGNVRLVQVLLRHIDAQRELGCQMGTALTVLILKRYRSVFTKDRAIEMVDLLIGGGANPLKQIGDFGGNALEFISKEYYVATKATAGSSKKSSKDKSVETNKRDVKAAKPSKALADNEEIKNYIAKVSKDILLRRIQILIVKFLIQHHSTKEPFNEFTAHLVTFLRYNEFTEIIQQLVYTREITPCPCLKPFLLQIGTYINFINPLVLPKGQTEVAKGLHELLDTMDYAAPDLEVVANILKLPEFDKDQEMFEVCYYCLHKVDKYLISCPGCGVVLFCSEACNRADARAKSEKRHTCHDVFYNAMKQKLFQGESGVENKFKAFQQLFKRLSSRRTTCLLGKNHLQQNELSTSSLTSYFSALPSVLRGTSQEIRCSRQSTTLAKEVAGPCRLSKHYRSCTRIAQRARVSITADLAGCAYSDLHQSKRSVMTPLQRKLTLMENLLKSMASGTPDTWLPSPADDILQLSLGKDKEKPRERSQPTLAAADKQPGTDPIETTSAVAAATAVVEEDFPIVETKNSIHDLVKHHHERDVEKNAVVADALTARNVELKKKRCKQMKMANTLRKEALKLKRTNQTLNAVLPKAYNVFLQKFRKMFPEFDLTTLFLPYACYCDGQLYYRFLDKEPVFMETYSNL